VFALSVLLFGCTSVSDAVKPVAAEGPYQVRVLLTGLTCCDSVVRLGLFRSDAHWLKQSSVFKARLVLTSATEQEVTLYGLPQGRYAIAAYQDHNNNGRLDRWLGLIPTEPVAYSMVENRRLPPSFADASFNANDAQLVKVAFRESS